MKIEYGMVLKHEEIGEKLTVGKYWEDDLSLSTYKVTLFSEINEPVRNYYVGDLKSLIQCGVYTVLYTPEVEEYTGKLPDNKIVPFFGHFSYYEVTESMNSMEKNMMWALNKVCPELHRTIEGTEYDPQIETEDRNARVLKFMKRII